MSLYNCEKCGVVENTALGFYWFRHDEDWSPEFKDKALCSECGPAHYSDGTKTDWGKWHGEFDKSYRTVSKDGQRVE